MSEPNTPPAASFLQRHRIILAVTIVICGVVVFLLFRPAPPPPAPLVFLPFTSSRSWQKPHIVERWIPQSWGWYWRTKERLFRRPKPVNIDAFTFQLSPEIMSNFLAQAKSNPSFCASNEIFGCLINPVELPELRQRLSKSAELLILPRVATAEKIETTISTSSSHGGPSSSMTFFPLVRGTNIDLSAIVSLTDQPSFPSHDVTPRTNLAAAVRAQVPVGGALMLLRDRTNSAVGLLLEVIGKK